MNFFANFPVADLERSKAFFTALGWSINEAVTDDNAAVLLVLDDDLYLMALRRDYYASLGDGSKAGRRPGDDPAGHLRVRLPDPCRRGRVRREGGGRRRKTRWDG